jgi:hypothetical protein
MPRPRPQFLQKQVTQHGKIVWYVRRGSGPRIRINGAYGSTEFMTEYHAAVASLAVATPKGNIGAGSLEWLIRRYRESSTWEALAPATRDQRENILRHVEKGAGDVPFKAITRAKIIEGREKRKATPNQANNFIKTMRGLFRWAIDVEHAKLDPTHDVKLWNVKTEGFHVWTDDELSQFEKRWPEGTRERLAFDLLLYTGLRRGDAVRLGRQHVKEGAFKIKTEKNGVVVEAPILPALARSIETAPTGDLAFIVGERGRPMAKESFGNWFREVCEAAKVPAPLMAYARPARPARQRTARPRQSLKHCSAGPMTPCLRTIPRRQIGHWWQPARRRKWNEGGTIYPLTFPLTLAKRLETPRK